MGKNDITSVPSNQNETMAEFSDIKFYSPGAQWGEFSNFYPQAITYRGKVYPTSEHAFQAAKFDYDGADAITLEYAELIRTTASTAKVFILAKQRRVGGYAWRTALNPLIDKYREAKLRPQWDTERVRIMTEIVRVKFADPQLRAVLLSTRNKTLVEHTTRDRFWGDGGNGTGANTLGKILMAIRDEILPNKP